MGNPEAVGSSCELGPILDALQTIANGPAAFLQACKKVGIKSIQRPFWKHLSFVNIFWSIIPDLLHQLYQGNIKHLINWLQQVCGETEIDAHYRHLPPNHNIQLFLKGISHLSRVTGMEHNQICQFLHGIIIDIHSECQSWNNWSNCQGGPWTARLPLLGKIPSSHKRDAGPYGKSSPALPPKLLCLH